MDNNNVFIDKNNEQIDVWAYIEIMGHDKIIGRVSERKVGVQVMLQIDVPKGETEFAFSKLFSPSSIFSIQPTTEAWCRKYAAAQRSHFILPYIPEGRQLNAMNDNEDDDFEEDIL